ncbi:MAG: DUF4445 domain-containing protein [Firmicutes bacterium]|nr:DUF4445 domain-containing protein [Bacillota bacterium]
MSHNESAPAGLPVQVKILPEERVVQVPACSTVRQAALAAGIELKSSCGGDGTCGRCRFRLRSGEVQEGHTGKLTAAEREQGWRLACQARVLWDVVVEIPATSRLTRHQILVGRRWEKAGDLQEREEEAVADLEPLYQEEELQLPPPNAADPSADATRLLDALQRRRPQAEFVLPPALLRQIPAALRSADWRVRVGLVEVGPDRWEVARVLPAAAAAPNLGLAVDIGTTTVVVQLVDLLDGRTLASQGTYNLQAHFGDDVISRIVHSEEDPDGLQHLQRAVVQTLNGLIDAVLQESGAERQDIQAVAYAGNTTMTHLFLGVPAAYLRRDPYVPAFAVPPLARAGELGLKLAPQVPLWGHPAVGSYVGGDIVAGVLATGVHKTPALTLFVDIGTNGEIVVGNQEWLMACACSAGPAFEGGGIKHGMRAMTGAIERIRVQPERDEVAYQTVGGQAPQGICGSGLIDALATLRESGIIDRSGNLVAGGSRRLRPSPDAGMEYVLAWAHESGTGQDITLTQADVKNLLRAKGAIYAGIRTLLAMVELPPEALEQALIAGGFGNYLNIHDAMAIGLLPDLPPERYQYVGNSSLAGARLALLSRQARQEALEIARRITYVDLSSAPSYMEEFVSALFLPHTDFSQFPRVLGKLA